MNDSAILPGPAEETPMPATKYTRDEVAARGEAIYERDIRTKVEGKHRGEFLVLDIETGEYEIDRDDLAATRRALAKRPGAVLYGLRIGYPSAYHLGGFTGARKP
jgi:hypothetical protein